MNLHGDEVGISDILQWRDCPALFEHKMGRHEAPLPGETGPNNAYGSCIHEAISLVETQGSSNADAVTAVWPKYAQFLDPGDLALLHEDLDQYRRRVPIGMRLVAAEVDRRVPLFVYKGRRIYFRFKIDVLYARIDDPSVFYMVDYKSTKWRKTQAEVDSDIQQWAYNFAVHELYPECRNLIQCYDQLRFGRLLTSKNADQRTEMKNWLIETITAILDDETPEPTQNEWCPWCPLLLTCSETVRATETWRGLLGILAPKDEKGKIAKIALDPEAEKVRAIIAALPSMQETRKHIEAVEKQLKSLIERMPLEEREELGWRLKDRRGKFLAPESLAELHELMGPSFYEVVTLSSSKLEAAVGKPKRGEATPPALEFVRRSQLEEVTSSLLVRD